MTKLEELRTAYAAATQGEWKADHDEVRSEPFHMYLTPVSQNSLYDDAKFIAAMHNALPALLEAVEFLQHIHKLGYFKHKIQDILAKLE